MKKKEIREGIKRQKIVWLYMFEVHLGCFDATLESAYHYVDVLERTHGSLKEAYFFDADSYRCMVVHLHNALQIKLGDMMLMLELSLPGSSTVEGFENLNKAKAYTDAWYKKITAVYKEPGDKEPEEVKGDNDGYKFRAISKDGIVSKVIAVPKGTYQWKNTPRL